jgi:quercetin dioxygenase-like cupin family protein
MSGLSGRRLTRPDGPTTHPEPTAKGPGDRFTGDVWFDVIAKTGHLRVNTVRFSPGARTAWHSHATGQTLYVSDGRGRAQSRGDKVIELLPGNTIYTPPGEWHWHGADPDHFMTHVAMSEATEEGPDSSWGDHVTDEEYLTG